MSENQLEKENKSNPINLPTSSKKSEPSEESKTNNINLDNGDKKKKYADMFNKLKDKIVKSLKSEKEKFNELNNLEKYTTFKKFVKEFREKNEQDLYKNLTNEQKERQAIKEKQIKEVIELLDNKKDFTPKDIAKIKDLASTENGFLKNEYRKRFYKFLFMIDSRQKSKSNRYLKQIQLLYKDPEKEGIYYKKLKNIYRKNSEEERHKIKSPSAHQGTNSPNANNYTSIFENYKQVKYDNIIEVDVKRTIFNSIFKTEKEKVMLDYLKEKITQKLKNFFSLDDNYKYYQGFHDIAIFIYILILSQNEALSDKKQEEQEEEEEEDDDILLYEILQRMAEFYLKDYLAEININNMDNNDNVISTTKSAFRFDNIYRIINDIKKNVDNQIYELIQNKSDFPDPIYTLPWALTYFTHDIKNVNIIYRIFDFVLFEHPASIFYLAANLVIDETKKMLPENDLKKLKSGQVDLDDIHLPSESHYMRMKDLNFDKLDFNKIILETEHSLNKVYPRIILQNYHNEFSHNSPFKSEENSLLLFRNYKKYSIRKRNMLDSLLIVFNKYFVGLLILGLCYYLYKKEIYFSYLRKMY